MTIGRQITEALLLHEELSRPAARRKAIEMLRLVRISDPEHRVREYPHQLSGGMRQRVMIAMALDVTIQAQILDIILELQSSLGPQGGGSACRRPVHASTASLHPRPLGVGSSPHPQAGRSRLPTGISAGDPRNGSRAHQPAPGLCLRAALCIGRRQVPPGIPAV
jgi:ABC transporter